MSTLTSDIVEEVNGAIGRQDIQALSERYHEQGEFLTIDSFLPQDVIGQFMEEVQGMRSQLNRNFIPGHKKGGASVIIF